MPNEPERKERSEGTGVNRKRIVTTDTGIYLHEEGTYRRAPVSDEEKAERLERVMDFAS